MLKYVILIGISLYYVTAIIPDCGQNATWRPRGYDCQTCRRDIQVNCLLENNAKCYCNPGYVRNEYRCILPEDCPPDVIVAFPCGINEIWQTSGYDCQTCRRDIQVKCALNTQAKCYCKNGYVRFRGVCILRDDCPPCSRGEVGVPLCGINEVWSNCTANCPPSCEFQYPPCHIYTIRCQEGCMCAPGYILNARRQCIPERRCPQTCSKPHFEWSNCGSRCPKSCQNRNRPVPCVLICQPGCFCKPPYILNEFDMTCVLEKDCP